MLGFFNKVGVFISSLFKFVSFLISNVEFNDLGSKVSGIDSFGSWNTVICVSKEQLI